MPKIKNCEFKSCVHNSACCHTGILNDQNKCNCPKPITFKVDKKTKTFLCDCFSVQLDKKMICTECKILRDGYITIKQDTNKFTSTLSGFIE